jgi:hypothetical protein
MATNLQTYIPDGVQVVDVTSFMQNGEVVDRVILHVNNHVVQICAYDNSPRVVVMVDTLAEEMHISKIDKFIRRHTA